MAKTIELDWDEDEAQEGQTTTPYQVEIPTDLHTAVMAKSKEIGIKVAPFVRRAFQEFRDAAPEELFDQVRNINKEKK